MESNLFWFHNLAEEEGRSRWTVRLLTEEVIKRKLVPRVGRETIRVLLESHDLTFPPSLIARDSTAPYKEKTGPKMRTSPPRG